MTVTIYHNPNCGTSRNVLAMIRQSGEEPVVIEYLKNPPSRERLKALIQAMGIPVRALLREKGTPYAELGLGDPKWSDDQLLDFMMAHPILINRPIVETPKGVKLCRPSETVLDILPNANIGQFVKEDGEVIEATKTSLVKGVSRPGLWTVRAQPDRPQRRSENLDAQLRLYENQNSWSEATISLHWQNRAAPSEPESHAFGAFLMEPNWGREFFYLNRL